MKSFKPLLAAAVAVVLSSHICAAAPAASAKSASKGVAVQKLSAEDASIFVRLTVQRTARFDELGVFQRVIAEKRAELKDTLTKLQKEFKLDPNKSYSYETKTFTLFELVPGKKEGDEPTRKEISKFKDAAAAAPLAREMVARKLVENQLYVLDQLAKEKSQEAELVDAKLRKIFKLAPDGLYSFNADDSTIYKTGTKAKPAAPKAAGKAKK